MRSWSLPKTFRWRLFYGVLTVLIGWISVVLFITITAPPWPSFGLGLFASMYIYLMALVILIASGIIWRKPY